MRPFYEGTDIIEAEKLTHLRLKNKEEAHEWKDIRRKNLMEIAIRIEKRQKEAKKKNKFFYKKHKEEFTSLEMKQAKIILRKLNWLKKRQMQQFNKVRVAFWLFFIYFCNFNEDLCEQIVTMKMHAYNRLI